MIKNKTALLIEGGGQRGVFSFGVIDAFIEAHYDPFDFFVGVSNGASVLFWYLIRDRLNNLEKMLFSANKKYFNYTNLLSGRDILDFYGLFRDAYEYFHPDLNLLKVNLAGRSFFSVVTNAETGNAEYIDYEEKKIIESKVNALNESGKFKSKIVTEIEALSEFYNAEDYHQDYYKKRGIDGCAI